MNIVFFPLDVTARTIDGRQEMLIFGRTVDNRSVCLIDSWQPSFYLVPAGDPAQFIADLGSDAVPVQMRFMGVGVQALKVSCKSHKEMLDRTALYKVDPRIRLVCEHDMDISAKYLLERSIIPFTYHEAEAEPADQRLADITLRLKSIRQITSETLSTPKSVAIQVMSEQNALESPILFASLSGEGLEKSFSWKRDIPCTDPVTGEVELLESIAQALRSINPDVIVGLGSDDFDLRLIAQRAAKYSIPFNIGADGTGIKLAKGKYGASITGIVHLDLERFANAAGEPAELSSSSIYALYLRLMPRMLELLKMTKVNLDTVCRCNYAQLLEHFLISEASNHAELIPPKPTAMEYESRKRQHPRLIETFSAGIYRMLRSMDLSEMITTTIIEQNISPGSLGCDCCEGFCRERKDFIISVAVNLTERRDRIIEMQRSGIDRMLNLRHEEIDHLLRALATFYAYPAARWYSMEAFKAAMTKAGMKATVIRDQIETGGTVILEDGLLLFWTGTYMPQGSVEYDKGIFIDDKPARYALVNDGKLKMIRLSHRCDIVTGAFATMIPLALAGDSQAALDYARDMIAAVKRKQIPSDRLATTVDLPVTEGSPARELAKYAVGKQLRYVIVRGDGPLHERARLAADSLDYDETYYVNAIILPALDGLVKVLGFQKDDLLQPREQARLQSFF